VHGKLVMEIKREYGLGFKERRSKD